MNRIVSLLAGLLCVSNVLAQTQKGNGILSGSLSVSYGRQERPFTFPEPTPTSVTTSWQPTVSITAGRFWTDNWLAGLSLSGASSSTRQNLEANPNRTYPNTSASLTATPFVRRYWQFNSVYLFAGVGVSVNLNSSKQSFFDVNGQLIESGQKTSSMAINPRIEAGVNYFLTNRLGLQLIANTNSLPLSTAGLNAGLVYWTGPGRSSEPKEERTNSQTNTGRWVLEGYVSVTNQKNDQAENSGGIAYQSTTKQYYFSPSVGFFISKNNLIGISVPISYAVNKFTASTPPPTQDELWTVGLSPYFQHYWTSTRLTPYTRLSLSYMRNNSGSYTGNTFNGGVSIGLAYMAGQRFIIETSLANASMTYLPAGRADHQGEIKTWGATISAGLAGNFSLRYVFQ